ncbi:hypothetical protein MANES_11G045800v8 [Manihot esculenta]|uniref:Uncharacterized protein n=1 Tax=Manihot esculenta TaxID=3983 RepID=A0ACB7GT28_MANES|nr:hypothetical protein MANES_11G045800v8 [Manihot esculenta]
MIWLNLSGMALITMLIAGECPEECREAVQSLIYAAARIPEFPELRDLRTLFVERYGTHLESFINKQFVETLRPKTTTKEMKLQLMHDIAEEFNIQWNAKSLEQELFKQPQENNRFPKNNDDISPKVNCKGNDGGDDFTKRTKHETGNKVNDTVEDTLLRKEKSKLAFRGRKNSFNERYNLPCSSEDKVISHRRKGSSDLDSLPTGNVHTEADLISEAKTKPKSVRRRPLKPPPGHETVGIVDRPLKRPPGHENFVRPESGAVAKADSTAVKEDEVKRGSMKTQGDDIDQKEEEEKIIDGLLMHYCKDSMKPNLKPPPKLRSTKSDLHFPPGREAYQAEEASPKKAAKGHNRLVSMQPENGHVHPNLPDYEDLAARFAALKRR